MPALQLLFSLFLGFLFLITVFILSWYLALPLLIIWAVWGSMRWLKAKIILHRLSKDANGCTIRPLRNKPNQTTIIDADYTEISTS